jgi:hypothetical protein
MLEAILISRMDPLTGRSFLHTDGAIAHIRGEKPGAARHDPTYMAVNQGSNLMLMCDEHHHLIDHVAPDVYTVEVLTTMRAEHVAAVGQTIDRELKERVDQTYVDLVSAAEDALDFNDFSAWYERLNGHVARLDRGRGRAIDEWSDRLLRTQMPSGIQALIEISRPQLEAALLQAAEGASLIVSSMRSVAEPQGDDLVEMTAPRSRPGPALSQSTREQFDAEWHCRLGDLGRAMGEVRTALNEVIHAFRDLEPTYRLGEPDL